jgi:hypothetical protein
MMRKDRMTPTEPRASLDIRRSAPETSDKFVENVAEKVLDVAGKAIVESLGGGVLEE